MRRIVTVLILLLISMLGAPLAYGSSGSSQLLIVNDNYSSSYIISGNGSAENPYLVENITLNVSSLPAIMIENSNMHLIIRNVTIYSENAFYAILIKNSSNVTLENVRIESSANYGIGIISSKNLTIKGLYFYDVPLPFYFGSPRDMGNNFSEVYVKGLKALIVKNLKNKEISGTFSYVSLYNCTGISLKVKVKSVEDGVAISFSRWINLTGEIEANYYGITVEYSKDVRLYDLNISRVGYNGIKILDSSYISMYNISAGNALSGLISADRVSHLSASKLTTIGSLGEIDRGQYITVRKVDGAWSFGISECYQVILEKMRFENQNSNVLSIEYSKEVNVTNCKFLNIRYMLGKFKQKPVDAVIAISSSDIVFYQDVFYNDWTGIAFFGCQNVLVKEIYVDTCTQGIEIKEWYTPNYNYTIKDSEFLSCSVECIGVMNGTEIRIVHNLFKGSVSWALAIMTKGHVEVYLNTFVGNAKEVNEWCEHLYYNPEKREGNYWSNYTGSGPYKVSEFSVDKYPLKKPTYFVQYTPQVPKPKITYVDKFIIFIVVVLALSIIFHVSHFRKKKGEERSGIRSSLKDF